MDDNTKDENEPVLISILNTAKHHTSREERKRKTLEKCGSIEKEIQVKLTHYPSGSNKHEDPSTDG